MSTLEQVIYALALLFLAWLVVRYMQNNPGMFEKTKLLKSLSTLGFLALFLMSVVWVCTQFL